MLDDLLNLVKSSAESDSSASSAASSANSATIYDKLRTQAFEILLAQLQLRHFLQFQPNHTVDPHLWLHFVQHLNDFYHKFAAYFVNLDKTTGFSEVKNSLHVWVNTFFDNLLINNAPNEDMTPLEKGVTATLETKQKLAQKITWMNYLSKFLEKFRIVVLAKIQEITSIQAIEDYIASRQNEYKEMVETADLDANTATLQERILRATITNGQPPSNLNLVSACDIPLPFPFPEDINLPYDVGTTVADFLSTVLTSRFLREDENLFTFARAYLDTKNEFPATASSTEQESYQQQLEEMVNVFMARVLEELTFLPTPAQKNEIVKKLESFASEYSVLKNTLAATASKEEKNTLREKLQAKTNDFMAETMKEFKFFSAQQTEIVDLCLLAKEYAELKSKYLIASGEKQNEYQQRLEAKLTEFMEKVSKLCQKTKIVEVATTLIKTAPSILKQLSEGDTDSETKVKQLVNSLLIYLAASENVTERGIWDETLDFLISDPKRLFSEDEIAQLRYHQSHRNHKDLFKSTPFPSEEVRKKYIKALFVSAKSNDTRFLSMMIIEPNKADLTNIKEKRNDVSAHLTRELKLKFELTLLQGLRGYFIRQKEHFKVTSLSLTKHSEKTILNLNDENTKQDLRQLEAEVKTYLQQLFITHIKNICPWLLNVSNNTHSVQNVIQEVFNAYPADWLLTTFFPAHLGIKSSFMFSSPTFSLTSVQDKLAKRIAQLDGDKTLPSPTGMITTQIQKRIEACKNLQATYEQYRMQHVYDYFDKLELVSQDLRAYKPPDELLSEFPSSSKEVILSHQQEAEQAIPLHFTPSLLLKPPASRERSQVEGETFSEEGGEGVSRAVPPVGETQVDSPHADSKIITHPVRVPRWSAHTLVGKQMSANDVLDDEGNTLLHIAAKARNFAAVVFCLRVGLRWDIKNKAGKKAYAFAEFREGEENFFKDANATSFREQSLLQNRWGIFLDEYGKVIEAKKNRWALTRLYLSFLNSLVGWTQKDQAALDEDREQRHQDGKRRQAYAGLFLIDESILERLRRDLQDATSSLYTDSVIGFPNRVRRGPFGGAGFLAESVEILRYCQMLQNEGRYPAFDGVSGTETTFWYTEYLRYYREHYGIIALADEDSQRSRASSSSQSDRGAPAPISARGATTDTETRFKASEQKWAAERQHLETELKTTRNDLVAETEARQQLEAQLGKTKEELGTTREELGTTREELGTTREELGTTREKLKKLERTLNKLMKKMGLPDSDDEEVAPPPRALPQASL